MLGADLRPTGFPRGGLFRWSRLVSTCPSVVSDCRQLLGTWFAFGYLGHISSDQRAI